jgi:hypothetical protein
VSNADRGSRHLCRRPLGFHAGAGRLPCRSNRITYLNVLVLDHFPKCQDFFSREPDQLASNERESDFPPNSDLRPPQMLSRENGLVWHGVIRR